MSDEHKNRGGVFVEPPGGETPSRNIVEEVQRSDLVVRAAGGYRKIIVDGVTVDNDEIKLSPFHPLALNQIDQMQVSLTGEWRDHTFIVGLKEIIPEDLLWRVDHPRVPALVCMQDDHVCECPWGCVHLLGSRLAWLFDHYPDVEQILVLFKRDEKELWRKMSLDVSYSKVEEEAGLRSPKVIVPRYWVLWVPMGFQNMITPYRLFRGNYDGLCHILRGTRPLRVPTPISFWMGGV